MVPTDYTHVWTFTPLPDVDGVDGASAGEPRIGVTGVKVVNRVKATLSTAGYLQPNDALKYTASDAANPNGPRPSRRHGFSSRVRARCFIFARVVPRARRMRAVAKCSRIY